MNHISKFIGYCFCLFERIRHYFVKQYYYSRFLGCGKNVYIGKNCIFTFPNIIIGEDVYIGPNAVFQSSYGTIEIKDHVMFGPGVNIHGGNHIVNTMGEYMKNAPSKKWGDDGKVVIEDDCWIGANAIILANVTVGRGSVIGAGTIVTKSVPPYSIVVGNPGKIIRKRFTDRQVLEHEQILDKKKTISNNQ